MAPSNKAQVAAAEADRTDRAQRAVVAFRKMQHSLTSYARAITGDPKVRVEISTGPPRTDGMRILYRPPIALGDKTKHQLDVCGKRDPDTGYKICPACKVREEVLVNIYHEIAHIAFGSFSEGHSHMEAAHKVGPEFRVFFNFMEDARVDSSMFRARKGVRKMMQADTVGLMRDGIPGHDGTMTPTLEAPLNVQISLGMYLCVGEYEGWRHLLHGKVVDDLDDDILGDRMEELKDADGPGAVYQACLTSMVRLRELGYFLTPEEQEQQRDQEGAPDKKEESDDAGQAEPGDEDGEVSPSEGGEEGDAGEASDGEDRAGDGAGGDGGGDDDASEAQADSAGPGEDEAVSGDGSGEDLQGEAPGPDPSGGEGEEDEAGSEPADLGSGEGEAGEEVRDPAEDDEGDSDDLGGAGGDGERADEDGLPEDQDGSGSSDGGPEARPQEDREAGGHAQQGASGPIGDPAEGDDGVRADEAGESAADADQHEDGDDEPAPDGGGDHSEDAEGRGDTEGGEEVDDADTDDLPAGPTDGGGGPEGGTEEESEREVGPEADQDVALGGGSDDEADEGEPRGAGGGASEDTNRGVGQDLDVSLEDGGLGDGDADLDEHEGSLDDGDRSDQDSSAGEVAGSDQPELREPSDPVGKAPEADSDDDQPAEAFDSGADEGLGGVKVEHAPVPELGSVEDLEVALDHTHPLEQTQAGVAETEAETDSIDIAVIQGIYFETPSGEVLGVEEYTYGPESLGWHMGGHSESQRTQMGVTCDMDVPESVLGPALLKTRRIFSDNKNSSYQPNLRSGRINQRVLGRRAWKGDDDRLFGKKRIPGKRDYAVQIMLDISSSNHGKTLALLKRSVQAQAELCARVGIDFSIIAHSCSGAYDRETSEVRFVMNLHHIKSFDEAWSSNVQVRLAELAACGGNLDGHAMEYGRKALAKVTATDKVLLYYTDGKMPAANEEEELVILQDQIKYCKRENITLLAVGMRTDSPVRHGLDTVRVEDDDDLKEVVDHLGKRLARANR